MPGGGARASGFPARRACRHVCWTRWWGPTDIPRELRGLGVWVWVGGCGEAMLTLDEETDEGRRDDRVGNSPGEGLLPSAGLVPFNFKLTDMLVRNG